MPLYTFKKITPVPTASSLQDIVLSGTNKHTPTVVHKQYAIHRIRAFYMRKVKYCSQSYHDRLALILEEFPTLDDLHPFYGDLMNVLYDRDHYKLALAQLSVAKKLVDGVGTEYVKYLKYADSLYRCKQLKRAALGRMSSIVKQQNASLAYLEQVRQHIGRLPSIDPVSRSLILAGFPNVGKSSLMNVFTNANVDVQPYAFTTKSLFVGHTDYNYTQWQVLDTPGILDHPLEERNVIEMQSITALAHLSCCVLYLMDVSANCGYTIQQQASLFKSMRPLFNQKPVILVLNKVDLAPIESLDAEDQKTIQELTAMSTLVCQCSCYKPELYGDLKVKACSMLKDSVNVDKLSGKKGELLLNKLRVTMPKKRDDIARPSLAAPEMKRMETSEIEPDMTQCQKELLRLERDYAAYERGEIPWQEYMKDREGYILDNEEWKYDVIPEIVDGMNIADYVDPNIEAKLEELEKEEEQQLLTAAVEFDDSMRLNPEDQEIYDEIVDAQLVLKSVSHNKKGNKANQISLQTRGRTRDELQEHLEDLGIDTETAKKSVSQVKAKSRGRTLSVKRGREVPFMDDDEDIDYETPKGRSVSRKRSRSNSLIRKGEETAFPTQAMRDKAEKIRRLGRNSLQRKSKTGESDNKIDNLRPKWLISGKMNGGTRDWR
ncbi:nucleolar GTP-binding protein, putative [Entamoeba invadens IP1]|uniref:Nucleolar GTP-binding protein 1 n=1 Tax=Entamoeba invadens IP1 TaxID=370355 RepID=A0A0A1U268_ENTIV|nr:nucleolar GTP-binding protein, putative [Entamoeba invadens IP1]ELP88152.1 nucleolar GTP-binding protein, putative [Entamoeba invadens IP1]|eukprot:XP_004254923.1 nucleolar GTP-binding protein, putative [Entamoeba invadens IP1]